MVIYNELRGYAESNSQWFGSSELLMPLLTSVLNYFNPTQLQYDAKLSEAFTVSTLKKDPQKFPRNLFTSYGTQTSAAEFSEIDTVSLPNFSLSVTIGPKFNIVADLPILVKKVEQAHNEQLKQFDERNPMFFINTSEQLAIYWLFMAEKILEFVKKQKNAITQIESTALDAYRQQIDQQEERPLIPDLNLTNSLKTYAKLCQLIGESFQQSVSENDTNTFVHKVDSSAVLHAAWEEIEATLTKILHNLISRSQRKFKGGKQGESTSLYELLSRASSAISLKAQKQIIAVLNAQASSVFFDHSRAEMYRKFGLHELMSRYEKSGIEDPGSVIEQISELPPLFLAFIRKEFPKEQADLDKLKESIIEYRDVWLKRRGTLDGFLAQSKLLVAQKKLANMLCAMIYSGKFISYKKDSASFEVLLKSAVSADLLSQLWKEYAGEAGFAITAGNHYFFVAQLAHGQYLRLNETPAFFDRKAMSTISFSSHEYLYQAVMYYLKAQELEQDSSKHEQAEMLYKEAIKIDSKNGDYKFCLARLLSKYPDRHAEAEVLYKEAIKIDSKNSDYRLGLARLLSEYPDRHAEATYHRDQFLLYEGL